MSTRVDTAQRTRALITVDTRQQTAYGTLRTYILLGYSAGLRRLLRRTSPAVYMTRGFIQIAGFTFGKATSFFDIVPGASFAYNAGMFHHPDTGDAGKMLAAYTAQFGNGVSGTIALEQSRVRGIATASPAPARARWRRTRSAHCRPGQQHGGGIAPASATIRTSSATSASISPGAPGWSALPRTTIAARYYRRHADREHRRHPDNKCGWAVTDRLHPEPADDRSWRPFVGRRGVLAKARSATRRSPRRVRNLN